MRCLPGLMIVVPFVVACGGGATQEVDDEPQEATTPTATTGDEAAEAPAVNPGRRYAPRPSLNVYVQGPDPAPGERFRAERPDDYRAEIVVTNTGDGPVELSFSMIDFDLLRDGEEVSCGAESQTDAAPGPATLGPGEAHTYEASFHCTIPEPGRYEIRAYMNFGAEIAPGEDRERFYVGSREIVVE